jgi:hypothetical protein
MVATTEKRAKVAADKSPAYNDLYDASPLPELWSGGLDSAMDDGLLDQTSRLSIEAPSQSRAQRSVMPYPSANCKNWRQRSRRPPRPRTHARRPLRRRPPRAFRSVFDLTRSDGEPEDELCFNREVEKTRAAKFRQEAREMVTERHGNDKVDDVEVGDQFDGLSSLMMKGREASPTPPSRRTQATRSATAPARHCRRIHCRPLPVAKTRSH